MKKWANVLTVVLVIALLAWAGSHISTVMARMLNALETAVEDDGTRFIDEGLDDVPTLPPETPAPRMEKARNKVDLNTVDAWVLTAIPGVGETIAQRVIAYRQAHGSFVDVRELMRVDGIGEKLYGVMLEYVEVP